MMINDRWVVFRSLKGCWVAIAPDNVTAEADTLDELIIKIDQIDHPERCCE